MKLTCEEKARLVRKTTKRELPGVYLRPEDDSGEIAEGHYSAAGSLGPAIYDRENQRNHPIDSRNKYVTKDKNEWVVLKYVFKGVDLGCLELPDGRLVPEGTLVRVILGK